VEGRITDCLSNRRIFVWAALASTAAAFCGLFSNWYCLVLLSILYAAPMVFAIRRARSFRRVLLSAVLCLPLLSFVYAKWRLPHDQNQLKAFVLEPIVLTGTVVQKPQLTAGDEWRFPVLVRHLLFPVEKPISGGLIIVVSGQMAGRANLAPGDSVLVRGRLGKVLGLHKDVGPHSDLSMGNSTFSPIGPGKAGEPQEGGDWRQKPPALAYFEAVARGDDLAGLTGDIDSGLALCRSGILNSHVTAIGASGGGLLTSMVLGGRAASLPAQTVQTFRNVGLSHILAASGFNLTVVIAMTYWLVRLVYPLGQAANLISFLTMAIYIALAGPSPSLIRAALMCSLLLLGRLWQRRTAVSATLSGALLVTWLFSPLALSDVGLQLSYAATGGIILGARQFSDWINRSPSILAEKITAAVSLALVAQLSVLPIQAFYFCQTGILFVVSNLLVVPVVTPVTILGFVSSLSALAGIVMPMTLPVVATVVRAVDSVVNLPLAYMLTVANFLDTIEAARLRLGRPELWAIPFYYLCLLAFFVSLRRRTNRLPALLLIMVGMTALAYKPRAPDLSLACFDSSTILLNADRNAVLQARRGLPPVDLDPAQAKIERYLNFNAVRNLSKIAPELGPDAKVQVLGWSPASATRTPALISFRQDCQKLQSWMGTILAPTLGAKELFSGVTLCQDKVGGANVLIVDDRRAMSAANFHSQEILPAMQFGATRLLVFRLDPIQSGRPELSMKELLTGANRLVEATGIEFIVLIHSRNQIDDLRSLLGRTRFGRSQTKSPITIACPEHVRALLIDRQQLSRATGEL
jgi:ComEC/Rec2-related protein